MMKKLRWSMETALFVILSYTVALVPHKAALKLGTLLGRLLFHLLKRRRTIAIDNIVASLPFLQGQKGWNPDNGTAVDIARRTFENLGKSLVEDCKLYHGRGREIVATVQFSGLEHYEQALARNRGVAFITAHCGNWELMALSFGVRVHDISVVARRQDNRYLNNVLEKIRMRYGNRVIYKTGALKSMISEFRHNRLVGMLIDQAVTPEEGVLVDFLGRGCWTTKLPTIISRKTGVPLIPILIHREGASHVVTLYPEMQPDLAKGGDEGIRADMAILSAVIEAYIVRHPDQWYWIHKRWKRAPQP
jgi:Kdo2-lipid IVA lauroyltransferase/acyltransferase